MNGATAPPASRPSAAGRRRATRSLHAAGVPVARVLSGTVLALAALAAIAVGFPLYDAMIALAAGLVAWEWVRLCVPDRALGAFALLAGLFLLAIVLAMSGRALLGVIVLAVAAPLVWLGWRRLPWLAAGVLYLGLPWLALIWLRRADGAGAPLVLWLLVVVCASDIGAYVSGRLLGGPKLVPTISPNKTWAGFAGGLLCAVCFGALVLTLKAMAPWPGAALASGVLGLLAQGGDLLESWIKRRFGVKDTGCLIPGHGGLLDRVDSLMMASVGTTLYVLLSGGLRPA